MCSFISLPFFSGETFLEYLKYFQRICDMWEIINSTKKKNKIFLPDLRTIHKEDLFPFHSILRAAALEERTSCNEIESEFRSSGQVYEQMLI